MPVTSFSGRRAWTVETEFLRFTLLQSGGHLAEIVLRGANEVNPLWVQSRPTIESDAYNPEIHGELYGTAPESHLLSALAGHNLCFPFWGNPSPSEVVAGMTFHGETNIRRWQLIEESSDSITLEVHLPESAATMRRRFWCRGHALHVDSHATNLSSWDRPFGWCEHATLGSPFLESGSTCFDASLSRGFVTGEFGGQKLVWPEGVTRAPSSQPIDLRVFSGTSQHRLLHSFLVEPSREWGFFTAFHPAFALLFGYVFRRTDFPWFNVWENNDANMQTRGMEFSNTPQHGTMKTLISSANVWGVPAYEWLDAHSTVTKKFIAFLHRIASDFRGAADIRVLEDRLEVFERGSTRIVQVPI